jgi:hypothetical protein
VTFFIQLFAIQSGVFKNVSNESIALAAQLYGIIFTIWGMIYNAGVFLILFYGKTKRKVAIDKLKWIILQENIIKTTK